VSLRSDGVLFIYELFRMSDEGLFGCPLYRRRWLLIKALETKPLKEALPLALAVEEFISSSNLPRQAVEEFISSLVSTSVH
jgi:hypothetical protein